MIGSGLVGVRTRQRAALCLGLLTCIIVQAASAADCPGHPDALGTSRTLVVDPREHPRIGTMQYAETLPLADHEVVLTFDACASSAMPATASAPTPRIIRGA